VALSLPAAACRYNAWRWLVVVFSAKQKQQLHHQQLTNGSTILFTFTFPVNLDLFYLSTVSFWIYFSEYILSDLHTPRCFALHFGVLVPRLSARALEGRNLSARQMRSAEPRSCNFRLIHLLLFCSARGLFQQAGGLFPSLPFCANKHYLLNLLITNWNNNPIRCQRPKRSRRQ
jgi:hypothetical protein